MSSQSSPSLPYHVKLFINGEKRTSSTGTTFKEHGASGQLTAVVEEASWADIEEAIGTASAAQPAWEKSPVSVRRDVLLKASAILSDPSKGYQEVIREAFITALGEKADWITQTYGGAYILKESLSAGLNGETFPSRLPGGTVVTQNRAYGVVLMMIPWNHPVTLAVRMVSLALPAGNAVLFRSNEYSTRLHEILAEAGVLNLIHISRANNPTVIPRIIAHKNISLIAFTGGTTVGRIIAAEGGKHLKQVLLELGGKAAAIVLDDADIEQAARGIVAGASDTSGQRTVADKLIKELVTNMDIYSGASGYGHGDIENFLQRRSTVYFTEKVPNPLLDSIGL